MAQHEMPVHRRYSIQMCVKVTGSDRYSGNGTQGFGTLAFGYPRSTLELRRVLSTSRD